MARVFPEGAPIFAEIRPMSTKSKIKKASNGFSSFMMELKKEAGFHGSMTELAKLAGPKWDKLSLEERQKYRAERPLALNPMRDTIDEITSGLGIVKPVWPLDNSVNESPLNNQITPSASAQSNAEPEVEMDKDCLIQDQSQLKVEPKPVSWVPSRIVRDLNREFGKHDQPRFNITRAIYSVATAPKMETGVSESCKSTKDLDDMNDGVASRVDAVDATKFGIWTFNDVKEKGHFYIPGLGLAPIKLPLSLNDRRYIRRAIRRAVRNFREILTSPHREVDDFEADCEVEVAAADKIVEAENVSLLEDIAYLDSVFEK